MSPEPDGKRSMSALQLENRFRIEDCGLYLQPIPDDSWITQQSTSVSSAVGGDGLRNEVSKRPLESLALLQDGQPGKPRLIDLQHQTLEEGSVIDEGKAIFPVVIGTVPLVSGGDIAVGSHVIIFSAAVSKPPRQRQP